MYSGNSNEDPGPVVGLKIAADLYEKESGKRD